jgi:dTDP-4-amino-4,6-dideoxygalactose transaminase
VASELALKLRDRGVDSRPMFYPLNEMPPFRSDGTFAVSKDLSKHCLMLPSSPTLTSKEIKQICHNIKEIVDASPDTRANRPVRSRIQT